MKNYVRLVVGIICWVFLAGAAGTNAHGTELRGRVATLDGAAFEGATVSIASASTSAGADPAVISDAPECGRTARTSASGEFVLTGVSPDRVYKLTILAAGYAARVVRSATAEAEVEVKLRPRIAVGAAPDRVVLGRVLDVKGAPVVGAVIEVRGTSTGTVRQYGPTSGTDPADVSDNNGEFVLSANMPLSSVSVRISRSGMATQARWLDTGTLQVVTMSSGASLTGRVVSEGNPVPHILIGMVASADYVGRFETETDENGGFMITHLPPNTDYFIYGAVASLGSINGAIPTRAVHVQDDGETTSLGDVTLRPGHRVSGRIQLADGETVPDDVRLTLVRDATLDSMRVPVTARGEFCVDGVPTEVVALRISAAPYQFSARNRSFEPMNRRLVGRVDRDLVGLELLLEKNEPKLPIRLEDSPASVPASRSAHLREFPLRGVEK